MKFDISYRETLLKVTTDKDIEKEVFDEVKSIYESLEYYIRQDSLFLTSYEPIPIKDNAPLVVRLMSEAAEKAGVGPMASVAGTFSELTGNFILNASAKYATVENGGDIFLKIKKPQVVGIHAGSSIFSDRLGFRVESKDTPLAICTSSWSVGHSLSLGKSDAVTVVSKSCPLADAAATSIANEVKGKRSIHNGIKRAERIEGIGGVLIIKEGELGVWGDLPEIIRL